MHALDITLFVFLCCVIGCGVLFRERRWVRILSALILLLTTCVSVFSLSAFSPRLAFSLHEREGGRWSEDFRDGVLLSARVSRPYYPYIMISAVGLALVAVISQRRKNDDG